MGRPKGSGTGKRGLSKTRKIGREPEEESNEGEEVIEEIVDEIAKEAVSTRRGASASKTAKKAAAKPKRETKRKAAKEEIIIDEEEEEDQVEDEPKGKRSGRNAVELAFSKSDDSGAESAEDSKKKKEKSAKKASSSKGKRPGSKSKTIVKKAKREEGDEDEVDEEDEREYEVERIIDVKTVHKKREFLIKWKGFSIDNSTWEPEENLDHAKDLVQVFLSKVEKGDVSRTRRLSTIQSTKSSSSSGGGGGGTGLRRTQQGRVTKSRSRTPSRRSVAKSDQQTEEAPLRPTKREPNGDLALRKFMRESVERKLELLKNKERPRPESSTLGTVAEEGGRDRVDARAPPASVLRNNNVNNRRRFGVFARTALACSAAAASAAALYLTSPDTLNWEHIAPHVRDAIRNIQERYAQLRAQAPF